MSGAEAPGPDAVVQAEEAKAKANEFFKTEKYPLVRYFSCSHDEYILQAIELYSKAIELNPTNAVYYANRSISHLRLENYGYALADASRAIETDKTYLKAYYRWGVCLGFPLTILYCRRAAAYMSLGKYKLALKDYEGVFKARPADKDAKMKYTECKKIVQQMAFQKAISVEETKKSVADSIDLESMAVDSKYEGPRLEGGKVTLAFMKTLMETYKKQGTLHRKFAFQILLEILKYFR